MSPLELNQIKTLNDFEINLSRIFENLEINKPKNKPISFNQKLVLLKNKKHANTLYKKLREINNFVSPMYAKKYLTGFLEYRGITFNEYLKN